MEGDELLRHDEQECEAHYDEREDADNDIEKGRIKFSKKKLYGRDEELVKLHSVYDRLRTNNISQIVFLPGYSGVGKSTLVRTFIEQLRTKEEEINEQDAGAGGGAASIPAKAAIAITRDVSSSSSKAATTPPPQDSKEQDDNDDDDENDTKEETRQRQQPDDDNDGNRSPPPAVLAPWFVSGKYAKLQSPVPYSAIADGINNFCKYLLKDKAGYPRGHVIEIAERLRFSIGIGNLQVLTELIPELGNLVSATTTAGGGSATGTTEDEDGDGNNSLSMIGGGDDYVSEGSSTTNSPNEKKTSVHRVKQVFRNFIKSLCTKERPMIFFLDDMQWCDVGSMDLLSALLYDTKLEHLMFIGSYRSNEVNHGHAFSIFMQEIEKQRILHSDSSSGAAAGGGNSPSGGSGSPTSGGNFNTSIASFTSSSNLDNHANTATNSPMRDSDDTSRNNSLVHRTTAASASLVERLELTDLSRDDIAEFISDTLNLNLDDVHPLTEAIYNKTLGNIFFTMQAMEELVRKNALFYDMMFFKWDWNLNRIELEDLLSDDVVDMVKDKIRHLPSTLQQALTTASYMRAKFDANTLLDILRQCNVNKEQLNLTPENLLRQLDMAVDAGLLIKRKRLSTGGVLYRPYTFAHDKIQEASASFVSGEEKNGLLFQIAKGLVHRSQSNDVGEDWMLFVGVHHLNSLPSLYHNNQIRDGEVQQGFTNPELAKLNLTAAKISIVKSAFPQAVGLLRAGASFMEKETRAWLNHYDLCFDLYHRLMETEYSVGHHDFAQKAVDEILCHAKSNEEKCYAHHYAIEIMITRNDRNYASGADKAFEYLTSHGVHVPKRPNKLGIFIANVRVKLAKRNRSLIEVADLPPASDYEDGIMQLLEQLTVCAAHVDTSWSTLVTLVAQRYAWQHGFSSHLPPILSHYAILLRGAGGLRRSSKFGPVALDLINKHCQGHTLCRGLGSVLGCVIPLRRPFYKVTDGLHEAYRVGISCGDVEWGCLAAMQFGISYFCSGWPINTTFEPKIIHFEEEGRRLQQPSSIIVIFSIMRQTLMNLHGRGSSNPVEFKGPVLEEHVVLEQFEGSMKSQTLRDMSIFRLLLACVFNDEESQIELVETLLPYPEFHFPLSREHLLVALMGLASFCLGRTRKDAKYTEIGRQKYASMKKLAKIGSPNAPPILDCLRAEKNPSRSNYDRAISACSKAGLLHFEALMNEHCARFLFASDIAAYVDLAKKYMTTSMWLYYYWGAMGKVTRMKEEFRFLQSEHQPQKLSNMSLQHTAIVPPQFGYR